MERIIANLSSEWQKLSKEYLSGGERASDITVKIGLPEQSTGDITMLRYFFPLEQGVRIANILPEGEPLRLNIDTSGIPVKDRSETIGRLTAFLAAIVTTGAYTISIDKKPYQQYDRDWNASSIFPICQVSAQWNEQEKNHYSILKKIQGDDLGAENPLFPFIYALKNVVLSEDSYKGTPEKKLSKAKKAQFIGEMEAYLQLWLPQMDLLSQIIWLYLLRNFIKRKVLWEKNKEEIDKNLVLKCRADAVSYGEGMYQLIENACLHSAGKKAWFGFRVYRAGGEIPMSDFLAEANTRSKLHTRYTHCFSEDREEQKAERRSARNIFNEPYRFFFEMYVVDCACDQQGIVCRFNQYIEAQNGRKIRPRYKKLWDADVKQQRKAWEEEERRRETKRKFEEPEYDETDIQNQALWDKAREQIKKDLSKKVTSIEEVFEGPPRNSIKGLESPEETMRQHIENATTHYGFALIRRIVDVNNGYLMGSSPDGPGMLLKYYNGNKSNKQEENKEGYVTEWYALLPISNEWPEVPAELIPRKREGIFGETVKNLRSKQIYIDAKALLPSQMYETIAEKNAAVRCLAQQLNQALDKQSDVQLADAVVLIEVDTCDCQGMELLSKALYSVIAEIYLRKKKREEEIPLRIALLLSDVDLCNEFIRLFSIFYRNGIRQEMENTQIAICSRAEDGLEEVNYILAGTDLTTAWESAIFTAHYGSAATLARLPVTAYLSLFEKTGQAEKRERTGIDYFPFDLYLKESGQISKLPIDPWQDSWFIRHMEHLLQTELQSKGSGCLVEDVHIRLGSKIHLSEFYEAQLLFHDSGFIFRFAYLLVQDLLYGKRALPNGKHILLLGYEKYSAQLVQQVCYWLRKSKNYSSVNTAIVRDGEEEGAVLIERQFVCDDSFSDAGVEVVSLLPVGTTLSTIYKMHNCSRNALPELLERANFSRNYCLVLVNKELVHLSGTLSDVTLRYWRTVEPEKKQVTAQRDRYGGAEINVKYLLAGTAEWFAPEECPLCRDSAGAVRPLISVTKSDVMPNAIFLLRNRQHGFFRDLLYDAGKQQWEEKIQKNNQKVCRLFGSIWYSHLYKSNNHFQFYVDFEKFFRDNREDIIETVKNWEVEPNAYNVVVSPLQVDNAPFIQAILDHVFCGNSKFVHLEFSKTYREEVRAKLSHISEEFRIIRRANPKARINVYFADISVISGSILNRARVLMTMLLDESGIDHRDVVLFKKVFLLVNRCSYDTIHSFVQNPAEDMKAYVLVDVPSYNVDEGQCPACNLNAKYRLLKKRSATQTLSSLFMELENKHQKRSPEDYERWLKEKILHDPSYFSWLKQWLHTNVPMETKKILCFHPGCRALYYQRNPDNRTDLQSSDLEIANWLRLAIKNYYWAWTDVDRHSNRAGTQNTNNQDNPADTIADIIKFARTYQSGTLSPLTEQQAQAYSEKVVNLVLTHLVGVRNYMRLESLHLSYQALENATKGVTSSGFRNSENLYKAIRKEMVQLLSKAVNPDTGKGTELGKMLEGQSEDAKEAFLLAYKMEWLISYIKVLSREHLSNYYCYRQAIAGIMSDLLKIASLKTELDANKARLNKEDKNWGAIISMMKELHTEEYHKEIVRLCVVYQYHLNMALLHRMADLQMSTVTQADYILQSVHRYYRLKGKMKEIPSANPWLDLPESKRVIGRYLKALKVSTMAVDNDIPCLSLVATLVDIETRLNSREECRQNKDLRADVVKLGRYIYLENVRMIYSGLNELKRQISQQDWQKLKQFRPVDHFRVYI